MVFLKQKTLWLGWIGILAVVLVFGLAMMGSVLGAKPKAIPVGIVIADEGAALPNGETLNVGKLLQGKLAELEGVPIEWTVFATETEAMAGIDDRSIYGALFLPADLSAGVLSAASPTPSPGDVRIVVNEGMNAQGSGLAKQALGQLIATFRIELSKQALAMAAAQSGTGSIAAETAVAMLTPFTVSETIAHGVGANQGNGAAPGMLVQIVWISAMVTAIVFFLTARRARSGGAGLWTSVALQAAFGILAVASASGLLVWSAVAWYGMELRSTTEAWFALTLAGTAFFLMISAGLNWLGMPAIGLAAVLMFFSMPVVNLAPEFLPEATKTWLYGWTPLRLAADHLRATLYFERGASSALWWIAGAGLLAVVGAGAKPQRNAASPAAPAANG